MAVALLLCIAANVAGTVYAEQDEPMQAVPVVAVRS